MKRHFKESTWINKLEQYCVFVIVELKLDEALLKRLERRKTTNHTIFQ